MSTMFAKKLMAVSIALSPATIAFAAPAPAAGPAPAAPTAPAAAPTAAPAAPTVIPPGSVLLRYKFVKGHTYHYQIGMDNKGTVTVGGQNVPVNEHIDMGMDQMVQSIDPVTGNATLQMQFDQFAMSINGKQMPLPDSALAPLKTPSTIVMSPTGKLVSTNIPAINAQFGAASPFSSMQSSPVLPDQPVKAGDQWTQSQSMPGMGITAQVPMMLTGFVERGGHKIARINQDYDMTMGAKPGVVSAIPVQQTGKMSGSGVEMFDTDLGLPSGMDMTMHMDTTMSLPAPQNQAAGAPPQQVAAHNVMDIHMTMTLTDKAPQ